jgi:thiamine pyrophosphate-dependent acetolactate synthase large subunit-like protein
VRALLRATALPIVETFQATGVVSRELESCYAGRVGLFRNQPGDMVLARADVLVTIGYDPVEHDPRLWNADPARTMIHIDSLPALIDNNYQPALELRGDIAATVAGLGFADVIASTLRGGGRVRARGKDRVRLSILCHRVIFFMPPGAGREREQRG